MAVILHKLKRNLTIVLTLIWCLSVTRTTGYEQKPARTHSQDDLIDRIMDIVSRPLTGDYQLIEGITIKKDRSLPDLPSVNGSHENSVINRLTNLARTHTLDVRLSQVLPVERVERSLTKARFGFGKNSFLTGFGLGFLAFGLKKLLLPIFIGAQIIKSILIAMFLPSILGSVGKLVGKGVTTFAQSSGSSNFAGAGADTINDFDFKDTGAQTNTNYDAESAGSDSAYNTVWAYPTAGANSINNMISNNNMLQYQDMANYLQQQQQQQQSGSSMAAVQPFNPISSTSLFGNSAFANDYANLHTKPTASTRA